MKGMYHEFFGNLTRDAEIKTSQDEAIVNTDEYQSYNGIERQHDTVCHGSKEYARDDDGDGFHEVHCNSVEGMWTDVRNFLRPLKGFTNAIFLAMLPFVSFVVI